MTFDLHRFGMVALYLRLALLGALMPALLVLAPPTAVSANSKTELFDPETGYRLRVYRAAVPSDIPEATRVMIDGVDRLKEKQNAILIDVMAAKGGGIDPKTGAWRLSEDRVNIPGSIWLPEVGRGKIDATIDTYFKDNLARATGGDKSKPIIIYCTADCWMSWNAARRAASYGYSNVHWFSEGTDGWRDFDRPLEDAKPVPVAVGIKIAGTKTDDPKNDAVSKEASDRNARDAVVLLNGYAAYKMAQYEKALKIWQPLADNGNPNAMLNISNLYEQGQGVPQDLGKAAEWMKKAAETGFAAAQLNYGLLLESGKGVERNLLEAGQWFEKAATQGDKDAAFNLGVLHATGFGGQVNDPDKMKKAKTYLEKAAKQGHPQAQGMLASGMFR